MQEYVKPAAPHAEAILASVEGRRRATEFIVTNFEHIPVELLAHQMRGAAGCAAMLPLIELATRRAGAWTRSGSPAPRGSCGAPGDRLLAWPSAAARYRHDWLPHADWVELEGIGHRPHLDVPLETAQLILGFTSR
ncbi:MAG: alpha/beta fold hydrolase [Solirubrobacteraceae bacterium]